MSFETANYTAVRVWNSWLLSFLSSSSDDPDVENSSEHECAEDSNTPPVASSEHE